MSKHRSIGERLRRASPERHPEILADWARNWQQDEIEMLDDLDQYLQRGDIIAAKGALSCLLAIADKRFPALQGILANARIDHD